MINEPKQRGVAESFDPSLRLLRDELATSMGSTDPPVTAHSEGFVPLLDSPRSNDVTRPPAMVLRSRSVKNIAERYRSGASASGTDIRPEEDSKARASTCIPRLVMFAVVLWCLVVLIVLRSIPWSDFEFRWVRKTVQDVQWLYPASRQECTAGKEVLRPVATCGLPKLANAGFIPGRPGPSKRPRFRHSPAMLDALKIMQPSRDYTHAYEFVAKGGLVPLPSNPPSEESPPDQLQFTDGRTAPLQHLPEAPTDELPQASAHGPPQNVVPPLEQSDVKMMSTASSQTGTSAASNQVSQELPQVATGSSGQTTAPEDVPAAIQATPATASLLPSSIQEGPGALRQNMSDSAMDSVDSADFAFKRFVPGSLSHKNVVWCEGSSEPSAQQLKPISLFQPVLFILGAQHSGTHWLAESLAKHSAFIAPFHSYKQSVNSVSNELHFFDRWPMPPANAFLDSFPSEGVVRQKNQPLRKALFDATPDYLFNSVAAPRIKALLPAAKFVVVLRDPVIRAYIAWRKNYSISCPPGTFSCDMPSFGTSVKNSVAASKARDCLFNRKSYARTWHTCFQCHYSRYDEDACNGAASQEEYGAPFCRSRRGFNIVDVGNYAAQIAWWFSFFRPGRFLFLSYAELQHAEGRREALELVAQHVGMRNVTFTDEMLADFVEPDLTLNTEEQVAAVTLRRLFDKSEEDLYKLLAIHGKLGAEFSGMPSEI
eukprot:jgi/Ulvmu1/4517/UM002_0243.1